MAGEASKWHWYDYNVILSDFRMPYLDGLGLYQALQRKRPKMINNWLSSPATRWQPKSSPSSRTRGCPIWKPFLPDDVLRLLSQIEEREQTGAGYGR